jgi:hypothetical protein
MKSSSLVINVENRPVELYIPSIPPEVRDLFVYELKTGPVQSQELCVELARRFNLNYIGKLKANNCPKWLQDCLISKFERLNQQSELFSSEDGQFLSNSTDIYSTIEALREEGASETVKWEFTRTEQQYRPELILAASLRSSVDSE